MTSSTLGTRPIAQAVVVGGLDDVMLTGRAGVWSFRSAVQTAVAVWHRGLTPTTS